VPTLTNLKITMLTVNFAPERSGIAPYTTGLATALADQGHDVEVLTSRPHYPEWRVHPGFEKASREQAGSLTVRRLWHYIPRRPGWVKRLLFEVSYGLRAVCARWDRPDLVICVSPALISAFLIYLRIAVGWHSPSTGLIVQDFYARGLQETASVGWRRHLGALTAKFEGWVLRRFDGIVVIHDGFRSQVVNDLGIDGSRVSVIRNWNHVTPEFECDIAAVRESLGWGDETVVLHTGAMGVKQGLENVVEAARLAEHLDAPIRFVLLGDGSQRPRLAAAAQGLSKIDFLDQVGSKAFGQTLVAADVLLVNECPGLKAMALPSKLTTYFRAGKPVVAATDARSTTAQELAAAQAGVQVAPNDPAELVKAVLDLSKNPATSLAMGVRGQAYCREHLGQDVALTRYRDWVSSLGASQVRRPPVRRLPDRWVGSTRRRRPVPGERRSAS